MEHLLRLPFGASELNLYGVHPYVSVNALDLANNHSPLDKRTRCLDRKFQCSHRVHALCSIMTVVHVPHGFTGYAGTPCGWRSILR